MIELIYGSPDLQAADGGCVWCIIDAAWDWASSLFGGAAAGAAAAAGAGGGSDKPPWAPGGDPDAAGEVDRKMEEFKRQAEEWEQSQEKPGLWERGKDYYERTGKDILDTVGQHFKDDVDRVRQKDAQERWWQETSKKLHEQYPHGHNPG